MYVKDWCLRAYVDLYIFPMVHTSAVIRESVTGLPGEEDSCYWGDGRFWNYPGQYYLIVCIALPI
jgi:hypothetical protein